MAAGSHLGIDVAEYDARIRTFVPFYEEMIDVAAGLLDAIEAPAPMVVDLGTGSGALAARCLARRSDARLLGVDADPAMLELARRRLGDARGGIQLRQADFGRLSIPTCHAVVASLSLHHVRSTRAKLALYRRIAGALGPAGLFVSADCMPASSAGLAASDERAWRTHLRETYSARQAAAYLRSWAKEDRYQPLDVELSLLARAGLAAEVAWRRQAFAVVVATIAGGRRKRSHDSPSARHA
jgi:SAM-dependent methyltransferase